MFKLNYEISRFAEQLGEDAGKQLKIAQYKDAYVSAIRQVCGTNVAMADLIFGHTNAFYVRRDDTPRKGTDKHKPLIVCEACIDDPLVRSELNAYREMLKLALKYAGIHCDEFRIIPARGGMRARHPFAKHMSRSLEYADALAAEGVRGNAREDMTQKRLQETVRRALCLAYGEDAHIIVGCVDKIELKPLVSRNQGAYRQPQRSYWLALHTAHDRIANLLRAHEAEIIARARELGLNVYRVDVKVGAARAGD